MKEISRKRIYIILLAVSLFLCICLCLMFNKNVIYDVLFIVEKIIGRQLRNPNKWIQRITYLSKFSISMLIPMILYSCFYIKNQNFRNLCTKNLAILKTSNKDLFNLFKDKKVFLLIFFLFLLYVIYLFPIILSDVLYEDDVCRNFEGFRGWFWGYTRLVSDVLSIFIHGGLLLADVSPLTQLLTIPIFIFTSLLLVTIFSENNSITFPKVLASSIICINPYFLECLSYKYDAPYMALSILFAILPMLYVKKSNFLFAFSSIICNLLVCLTYQASLGIYPLLVLFIFYKNWKNENYNLKKLVLAIISYLFALLYFRLFMMQPIASDGYVSGNIFSFREIIPGFYSNLLQYYNFIITDFPLTWKTLILISIIVFFIKSILSNKRNFLGIIVTILFLFLSSSLVFGIYPLSVKPLFACRAMYGFGVYISFVFLSIVSMKCTFFEKFLNILIVWFFFSFSFVYGNALSEQCRFIDFRIQQIINDLNDIEEFANDNNKNLEIDGSIGISPILKNNAYKSFPILKRLNTATLSGPSWWRQYYFFNYFDFRNIIEITDESPLEYEKLQKLKDTMYHTIYGDGTNFIVKLK